MFCFLLTPILWRRSVETHICVSASKVSKVEGGQAVGAHEYDMDIKKSAT